ncbi:MAG: N-acetyl-gamma-glutamyl-phosphate reductase [Candidatus Omnitrophota bacterium]
MIKVGIIGITGYTGQELMKILIGHPDVKITYLFSRLDKPKKIGEIFPKFNGVLDLECSNTIDIVEIKRLCEIVFLALPHTVSMQIAPRLISQNIKVVDLSADYRFKNSAIYENCYKIAHSDKDNIKNAVYGLSEINKKAIEDARLIANPGCYPTPSILACAPLLKNNFIDIDSIIIDAKSGVSGAGKKKLADFMFCEVNENFKAYKINCHQHMPEINDQLSEIAAKKVSVNFVPHLIPINRGILTTIYVKLGKCLLAQDLIKTYRDFYADSFFIRIREEGEFPELKDVINTNFCDIGICVDLDKKIAIIICVIDNLLKGASGQAVQNLNIMCGLDERAGLVW